MTHLSPTSGNPYGISHNTQLNGGMSSTSYGLKKGTWLVHIIEKGDFSLGESLQRMISKELMAFQKEKYVRGSVLHIIKGDVYDGENYTEILGSAKKIRKKMKACFNGYPEIQNMVDEIDFTKLGYTQSTINRVAKIVKKYNTLKAKE
jgi:hypothetical protein